MQLCEIIKATKLLLLEAHHFYGIIIRSVTFALEDEIKVKYL